jgi:glycosyltransferase involved in cell wall biosynthesis
MASPFTARPFKKESRRLKSRKKLAIVSPHHWTGSYGGAEYQISLLLGELVKEHSDIEIHYLCKASENHTTPSDHTIHEVATKKWYSKYGSFFDALGLYRSLKQLQPDFIYQRVGCSYTGVCAYYANKHAINMIWHIAHDLDVRPDQSMQQWRKPHHWLEKKLLEYGVHHAPMIVAQKQSQADDLKTFYNRCVNKIVANFQPNPHVEKNHSSKPHVVWISNHKPEKNPEIFIDLAEELCEKLEVKFTMAGRPLPTPWGKSVVERAKNSPAVNFVGELKQEDLNLLLESAHLMVNTSDHEGFPNTFIQSWMREVPVISLYVDPDGVLSKNKIGVLCKSKENLISECAKLINKPEERKAMALSARDYATHIHSLENAKPLMRLLLQKD